MTQKVGLDVQKIPIEKNTPMGGYSGRNDNCKGEHDPLHIKTCIIEKDGQVISITSCDLVGLEHGKVMEVKEKVKETLGIPQENVLISATHTHSGPRNIALFGEPFEGHEFIYEIIFDSITKAFNSKFPATVSVSSDYIKGVSFNRRTYDPTSEHVDDECIVLTINDKKEGVKAIIYNFACHPVVMGADNYLISADWPSFANKVINDEFPGAVPIFLQGAAGNLNPVNTPLGGQVPKHDFNDCQEIGEKIGKNVVNICKKSREIKIDRISGSSEDIEILADDEEKQEIFTFTNNKIKDGELKILTTVQALQ
ncbi:MAG: neutral/alkaline non-lysosomal ceramidase N-terminal domain-containing protein, partial [Promethearchaeota archaeon]